MGNSFDRGPDGPEVVEISMRLQEQGPVVGGEVIVLRQVAPAAPSSPTGS
jgi:hypothetical protein